MSEFPSISIVTPTLNSKKTIKSCLDSISNQDYPKDKVEIIIADGGSTDTTLDIIKAFGLKNLKILPNALRTGEAGKAVGAKAAIGEIVAFIDSDNILPAINCLKIMVEPFADPEIIASEPVEYTYRKTDNYLTRYCALMGMNDPLCFFLGNYDRYNTITGKWTGLLHVEEDKGNYLKIELYKGRLPTIGANGFLIRKNILTQYAIGDYLFDIDVIADVLNRANRVKIAKVKAGIIHIFAGGMKDFMRKQSRRIIDYNYYKKLGLRKYQWREAGARGIVKFIVYNILIIPLILQSVRGWTRKKDGVWFFHTPACLLTLFVYSYSSILNFFTSKPLSRDKWQVP